ncbi:hypothetical protein GIB67_023284 [Kingdonia uniflora]|uniref:Fe2OG dioxygenase domain-containing protein n=1 Tax=Kingdonia uniflora TaxID=39325 RepID=A0A7J7KXB3_9MAGN|nr:hypothetical protein GIB67_023284 [Kingdonia uniflora]
MCRLLNKHSCADPLVGTEGVNADVIWLSSEEAKKESGKDIRASLESCSVRIVRAGEGTAEGAFEKEKALQKDNSRRNCRYKQRFEDEAKKAVDIAEVVHLRGKVIEMEKALSEQGFHHRIQQIHNKLEYERRLHKSNFDKTFKELFELQCNLGNQIGMMRFCEKRPIGQFEQINKDRNEIFEGRVTAIRIDCLNTRPSGNAFSRRVFHGLGIGTPSCTEIVGSQTARASYDEGTFPIVYQLSLVLDTLIDLDDTRNKDNVIREIREASETWGFFQVVNHGIPIHVLEEMLQANWRDTLFCAMAPEHPDPEEFPVACRSSPVKPEYLKDMDCAKGRAILCHYYPACPEPELTMGTTKHSDPDFLSVLLQDHISGLQALHQGQWVDVPPVPGALVVNIGDLLQASISAFNTVFILRFGPLSLYRTVEPHSKNQTPVRFD